MLSFFSGRGSTCGICLEGCWSSKESKTSMFISIVLCYVLLCIVNRYYEKELLPLSDPNASWAYLKNFSSEL